MSSSLATSNLNEPSANNAAVRRELIIASSFIKSYYTLLNRGPQYVHNFYSDHSSFIHGTVESPNDNHTGPVVGREKISQKIQELNLHDCRAKISQIDCLETLSDGLLIQVIGRLSNDGQPMRRFLQTFVLARSTDGKSGDSAHSAPLPSSQRRSTDHHEHPSTNSPNEKFYVRNSIFRYQDDALESEAEESELEQSEKADVSASSPPTTTLASSNLHPSQNLSNADLSVSQATAVSSSAPAATSPIVAASASTAAPTVAAASTSVVQPPAVVTSAPATSTQSTRPAPTSTSNEPKTWANMVRSSQQQGTPPCNKVTTSQATSKPVKAFTELPPHQHQQKQQLTPLQATSQQPSTTLVTSQQQTLSNANKSTSMTTPTMTTPQIGKPNVMVVGEQHQLQQQLQQQQQQTNHNQSSINQQQNQQSRRRLSRKSSNKGPGGNRSGNKIRNPRPNNSTTASDTAPFKQQLQS